MAWGKALLIAGGVVLGAIAIKKSLDMYERHMKRERYLQAFPYGREIGKHVFRSDEAYIDKQRREKVLSYVQ